MSQLNSFLWSFINLFIHLFIHSFIHALGRIVVRLKLVSTIICLDTASRFGDRRRVVRRLHVQRTQAVDDATPSHGSSGPHLQFIPFGGRKRGSSSSQRDDDSIPKLGFGGNSSQTHSLSYFRDSREERWRLGFLDAAASAAAGGIDFGNVIDRRRVLNFMSLPNLLLVKWL